MRSSHYEFCEEQRLRSSPHLGVFIVQALVHDHVLLGLAVFGEGDDHVQVAGLDVLVDQSSFEPHRPCIANLTLQNFLDHELARTPHPLQSALERTP